MRVGGKKLFVALVIAAQFAGQSLAAGTPEPSPNDNPPASEPDSPTGPFYGLPVVDPIQPRHWRSAPRSPFVGGPYGAGGGVAVHGVPEPSSLLLAALALFASSFAHARRRQ